MQVRIKYLPSIDGLPPKIETLSTPWTKEWEHATCEFMCCKGTIETVGHRNHLWTLSIVQIDRKKLNLLDMDTEDEIEKEHFASDSYRLLSYNCETFEDYVEWLEENVLYVAVDGEIYWANQQYTDSEADAE